MPSLYCHGTPAAVPVPVVKVSAGRQTDRTGRGARGSTRLTETSRYGKGQRCAGTVSVNVKYSRSPVVSSAQLTV